MSIKLAKRLAREITEELFTNGVNKKARRLVLEMDDGTNGGGWATYAAQDKIEKILIERLARNQSAQQDVQSDGLKVEPFEYVEIDHTKQTVTKKVGEIRRR